MLAAYACHAELTRGRRYTESAPQGRNQFQRDRDRIVHCNAFRRLEYKTQVFVNHEGDLFRTRLTHSIEVAQIARSIARRLFIHEDLVEAISLAHDLGHTPFGHAGQEELNQCVREHAPDIGGFEHNLQSLRIVDHIEERYAEFNGLNLCFETREGILKHCNRKHAERLGEVAQRFLAGTQPSLEAQITNLADEIAYNHHDIDDGLRSGLITWHQLLEIPVFALHHERVLQIYPQLHQSGSKKRLIGEIIRRMIHSFVVDLCTQTEQALHVHNPQSVDELRQCPKLAAFSPEMRKQADELKRFLRHNLYHHDRVMRMTVKARRIIRDLFEAFVAEPGLLSEEHRREDFNEQVRAIADYVAGMTDRFAIKEHHDIFAM